MNIQYTDRIVGAALITLEPYRDGRGIFMETRRDSWFEPYESRGPNSVASVYVGDLDKLHLRFRQSNVSVSMPGVIRGMHIDTGAAKLVQCLSGRIYDVVVDMREGSPTFHNWAGWMLQEGVPTQVLCPAGCAHGFYVAGNVPAIVAYHLEYEYEPEREQGLRWNEPTIGIEWPFDPDHQVVILSNKDNQIPYLTKVTKFSPDDEGGCRRA